MLKTRRTTRLPKFIRAVKIIAVCRGYAVAKGPIIEKSGEQPLAVVLTKDEKAIAHRRVCYFIMSVPIYSRSTSGTVTEPSAF